MAKIETVLIQTLANLVKTKKKNLNKHTAIYLYQDPKTIPGGFISKTNTIYLTFDETTLFTQSLEKTYKINMNKTIIQGGYRLADFVSSIKTYKKIAKDKLKQEKSTVQDFIAKRDSVEFFNVVNEGRSISLMDTRVDLPTTFWSDFDEWYSKNKKLLLKKTKSKKSDVTTPLHS